MFWSEAKRKSICAFVYQLCFVVATKATLIAKADPHTPSFENHDLEKDGPSATRGKINLPNYSNKNKVNIFLHNNSTLHIIIRKGTRNVNLKEAIRSDSTFVEDPKVVKYFSWPKSKPPRSIQDATDPEKSTFSVVNLRTDKCKVGETLLVRITARNGRGEQKSFGGDFWRVFLKSPDDESIILGTVQDHNDGSYTARVSLQFPGMSILTVTLVHPSEAVDLLRRVTSTGGSPGLRFHARFHDGTTEAWGQCNTWLDPGEAPKHSVDPTRVCNLSSPTTGEPWFCERPAMIGSCTSLVDYKVERTQDASAILLESGLFTAGVNLRVEIGDPQTVIVLREGGKRRTDSLPACKFGQVGTEPPRPAGYFHGGEWRSLRCSIRSFENKQKEANCLRNKSIHIMGDSTIRQWYSYYVPYGKLNAVVGAKSWLGHKLGTFAPVQPYEKAEVSDAWEPRSALDPHNNVFIYFSAHGPPLQNGGAPRSMPYLADMIDKVKGGPDTVVAVTVGMHLLLYRPGLYVQRLLTIKTAFLRLHSRSPETLLVFKGLNTFTMDESYPSECCLSQWLALRFNEIARSLFKGTSVLFFDSWDISASYNGEADGLHPAAEVVRTQVYNLLSFICPEIS